MVAPKKTSDSDPLINVIYFRKKGKELTKGCCIIGFARGEI